MTGGTERRVLLECHVCGKRPGTRQPRPDIPPTCPRNECQLAAAGIITVEDARQRLAQRGEAE